VPAPSHLGLILLGLLVFSIAATGFLLVSATASTSALGGINVEPAARPWQYVGANPDSWWCPTASQCTTSNPLGRIDTEMSLAQQLHVSNVRLEIPWFLVEPSKGGYDWSRADYIFSSAAAHGIVIQPILVYTPAWDGGYNAFPVAADFQAFVTTFMGRYGSRINAVEMWNEPDGGQSLAANNPAQYVQTILIPGYNAVKSTRPNVSVIEGGSINDSGTCCAWLSGVYNAGGGAYFDIAAFHDYGGNYGQVVQAYRGVMNAHGQGGKPIWMGEYGVSDATGSQQSSLIQGALTTPGLAMAQYYTLRDESVYHCCPPAPTGERKQFGVVAADDVTKKSSFNLMQSLLGGTPPPPPPAPSAAPAPTVAASPTTAPAPTAAPSAAPKPVASPPVVPVPPPSSVPTVGGLHVRGNQIVDANGNIVRLQGANMAGTEFVCSQGWSSDPYGGQPEDSPQTFAAMHAWRVNVVRIPLNEDCWLGINGAKIGGAAYQSVIIKLVQDLRATGFYVIVDLHWSAPGTQLALSQNPAPDEDHSPAFWQSVAATFKSDQGVIYDLFNEPFFYWIAPGGPNEWACLMNGCTLAQYETGGKPFTITANWKSAGMNELISVVRAAGAQNLIMVPGVNWARDLSSWLANRPLGSNIAAAWHSYPSGNPSLTSECAAPSCWNSVTAPLASQVPVVVGETGDSAAGPQTYLPTFLPWASAHGLNVVAWTWNAWTNPDDVLVSNMQTGAPTAGEGVTYKAWLTAQPVPSAAPASSSFTPAPVPAQQPSTSTAPTAAPKPAAPKAGATPPARAHADPTPVKQPVHSGPKPGAVTEPGASRTAQPKSLPAADRIGLEAIYIGFALIGLAAAMWGVTSLGPLLMHLFGQALRAPRPI
jgi:endoglucanase